MLALARGSYRTVRGAWYGTPKELWGFRAPRAAGRPERIAAAFLAANADHLGLRDVVLRPRRVLASLGAWHVILSQQHRRHRIHRAYVSVHVGRDHCVYLVKNRARPAALLPPPTPYRWTPRAAGERAARRLRRGAAAARILGRPERLWYPERRRLRPAYKVRIARLTRAGRRQEWIAYVDARTGKVFDRYDNLARARGRARVFDPNPVVALGSWRRLLDARGEPRRPPRAAYVEVALRGLAPGATLDGARVTTRPTRARVRRAGGDFRALAHERGFEEAMAYFHIDRAIRYLEALGYRGRRRRIFASPVAVDAWHHGADDSWYSPGQRRLVFAERGIDGAEDAETILHELGHAIQDAICPDFGQSHQAAAMGEGFGDYFAASFFAGAKPARWRAAVASWYAIDSDDGDPPALRRVDARLTAADFDARRGEHWNGQIWSATLWDVGRALGRRAADRLILESHFQLDGFTDFARGARALLDADANLYAGRHARALRRILARRRIAPL